jgi:hypothetical protein
VWSLLFLVPFFLFACASAPRRSPTDAVPIGEWCQQVGDAFCKAMADRCFGGMSSVADGCRDTFKPSCLAGRAEDGASGRTGGDLDRCVASMRPLTCEGLGAGIGSGSLATFCAVR